MKSRIINLTQEERTFLKSKHRELRKAKGNTNLAYRINAILLLDQGLSFNDVAKYLLLDDDTIRTYANKYLNGQDKELLTTLHEGKKSFLTKKQKDELAVFVDSQILLSVLPAIAFVKEKFDVEYSRAGMTELLHDLGFSYKKPKLVGAKANKEKQERFIAEFEEKYNTADLTKTVFLFADGVHPQHNTVNDYGWVRTNQEKYVLSNTGRQRVNVLAAVDIESEKLLYTMEETINAYSVINLFKDIEIQYADRETIYFISDNAKYFHSNIVKEYLANPSCKIKVLPLPSYSPNLNIIERLWDIMRKQVLSNKYYSKFAEFKDATIDFLNNCWSKFRDKLASKLNYNFHLLPDHAYA